MTRASDAREFGRPFRSFLEWVHSERFDQTRRHPVVALFQGCLRARQPLVDLPNGPTSTLACVGRPPRQRAAGHPEPAGGGQRPRGS